MAASEVTEFEQSELDAIAAAALTERLMAITARHQDGHWRTLLVITERPYDVLADGDESGSMWPVGILLQEDEFKEYQNPFEEVMEGNNEATHAP